MLLICLMSSTTQSTRSRSSRGSVDSIALEMGRGSLSTHRSVSYSSNSAILPLLDGDDEESRVGYNDEEKRYNQKLHIASENMSIVVSGMTKSTSGSILYILICTMTLGLGYLALRYLPRWRSYLTLVPGPLKWCESILIEVRFKARCSHKRIIIDIDIYRTNGEKSKCLT